MKIKKAKKQKRRKVLPFAEWPKDDRWDVFIAYYKYKTAQFAFVPPRERWERIAQAMGLPVEEFNAWARYKQWWVD